jgi:hypothetical protein
LRLEDLPMAGTVPPRELQFSPPASYAFEPELQGPAPRPIPELLRQGPYAKRRRDGVRALLAFGAGALLLDAVPGVDVLALYLLPLAYLSWIGFGALAIAALSWLDFSLRLGPFRYVRDGVPLVVRVVDLVKGPSRLVNGQPTHYAYTAEVAFAHPLTAAPSTARLRSDDFPASGRNDYDTPFRIGDSVTAVYLTGRVEKSLRLYAFLGLHPEVRLRCRSAGAGSPWRIAAGALALLAIFVVAFANVYAFGRYEPLDLDFRQAAAPVGAGALLLGGAALYGMLRAHRREQRRIAEQNLRAAAGEAREVAAPFGGTGVRGWLVRGLLVLGMPLLGGVTALCWAFLANAWLDDSQPRPQPARIHDMTMTTYDLIFRDYELSYVLDGGEEVHKLLSTPQHSNRFEDDRAVAWVRAGRFGWSWVETVMPAEQDAGI